MKTVTLLNYFKELDNQINNLNPNKVDQFVFDEFPNYPHIGKYIDPRENENREYYKLALNQDLTQYSFDPLISFEMNQIKYSVEILHPNCNCFRRSKTKKRPIKTTSHRDRILYAAWNYYLSKKHKKWIKDNMLQDVVSAYIPKTGKFNAHFSKLAFDYIQGKNEYSATALDIKSFFDKIPHKILKNNLIELIDEGNELDKNNFKLFKANTNYTYVELNSLKEILNKLESSKGMYMSRTRQNWDVLRDSGLIIKNKNEGIPQGLPCSGVLSNIAMMQFDLIMNKEVNSLNSIYLRYADDIFIAAPNNSIKTQLVQLCYNELNKLSLPIAENKTEEFEFTPKTSCHPKISYLGLNCQGNKISVRQNGINKFYQRTSQVIYSYVLTCKRRGKTPSRKKIRAIFTHSGKQNFYSYLRRVSKVFENDSRYYHKKVKQVLKKHVKWIDNIFDNALKTKPPKENGIYQYKEKCNCPLKKDE